MNEHNNLYYIFKWDLEQKALPLSKILQMLAALKKRIASTPEQK